MSDKSYQFVLYDTSDFEKFPIGGQLTSIRNFLRYAAEQGQAESILLVGVTTDADQAGKLQKVTIQDTDFDFFPVLYRSSDLNAVQSSLRVAYLKALCRHHRQLPSGKKVIHYLHTPEAFLYLKAFHPFCKTAVFSHGSFFNMVAGFRFYQNSKVIGPLFNGFVRFLLRKANLIFTLDKTSTEQYRPYNDNVVQVENSVVLPKALPGEKLPHDPLRLLFVGRLSKVKQVDGILRAMAELENAELTIVGDGEEREALLALADGLGDRAHFLGAVEPSQVGKIMDESDILIMNSSVEGKPMTIIEAMSHGLPVISTPVGGIPDLVHNGLNGVLTDGSVQSIAAACREIIRNYSSFSEHALAYAERYDYRRVNGRIWDSLRELID